ncbi:hypothetical protein MVEN_01576200 [Mycena venus]|uniref:Cytochrome P450 n=1 Tax=Mycena venus TaxID=2733690 RepID=A0A8H6XSL9_9AGAR|nr:hypothetical protein MVEN_01576200 [Mycena venus]
MSHLDIKRTLIYGLAAAIPIFYFRYRQKKVQGTIPALVESKGPISGPFSSLYFLWHATDVLAKGYHMDRSGIFQGTQMDYTITPEVVMNPYHGVAIRASLTRNLGRRFPEVRDEIVHAFDDVLALEDNEWKLVQVLPAILQVIARTSNRLFVGLPLCREQEYLDLNINFATDVNIRGQIIHLLPHFLKPILGPILSPRRSALRRMLKFLGPTLDARLEKENQYGPDWPERPARYQRPDLVAPRLRGQLSGDPFFSRGRVADGHKTLTSALYDLTAYPSHIVPMREEAERVVAQEGWTKAALGNMHKVDSFLRESQRLTGLSPVSMGRKVVAKDGFTFSDGMTLPHGATVMVPSGAMQLDEDIYPQAEVFDGFRFSRMREALPRDDAAGEGEGPSLFNRHMVSTAPDHLVFGHGRHACPGRFFAATELKAMLAHILINYDIKAETEGVRPPDTILVLYKTPSRTGKIWIRKRARGSNDKNGA